MNKGVIMSTAKKIIKVPENGQISIGKDWAGKEVQIEVVSDSQILITAGAFIPEYNKTFYTKESNTQLDDFNKWATKSTPKKTDIQKLKAKLGSKK